MNTFGYEREIREKILNQILNQQSDELINIKESEEKL